MNPKIILTSLLLLSLSILHAQDNGDNIDNTSKTINYQFTQPARVIRCWSVDGGETKDTVYVASGTRFQLVEKLEDGSAIIEFWLYQSADKEKYNFAGAPTGGVRERSYFKIRPKDLAEKTKMRYATGFLTKSRAARFSGTTITGGVIVMPYKFRPKVKVDGEKKGFDFSKDISLGISGGIKQRLSNFKPFFLNALLNVGIADISMDEYNTNGKLTESRDVPALTISAGLVFDLKKIQLGAFIGWDKVSDKNRNNWIYQGKPWFSIGFGYSIFSVSTTQNDTQSGNQSTK